MIWGKNTNKLKLIQAQESTLFSAEFSVQGARASSPSYSVSYDNAIALHSSLGEGGGIRNLRVIQQRGRGVCVINENVKSHSHPQQDFLCRPLDS